MNTGVAILIATGVTGLATALATHKDETVQSPRPDKRRTKDDYTGTSFNRVATYGTRPLQPLQQIQPIQPLQELQQIQPIQQIQPVQPINPGQYRKYSTIHNDPIYNYYNDPYQINSLADVVFNKAGRELVVQEYKSNDDTAFEKVLRFFGQDELVDALDKLPVLGRLDEAFEDTIIVGADYLKRAYIDPLASGNFKEAGINALMASGEDLDVLTNPIKGLLIQGPKGAVRGLGLGSEGRTNYDFNTQLRDPDNTDFGEFLINLTAEVMVDPLNVMTLGGKSAAKAALKETGVHTIKQVARTTGTQLSEELVQKTAKIWARETLRETLEEVPQKSFKNAFLYLSRAGVSDDTVRLIANNLADEIAYYNAKTLVKGAYGIIRGAEATDKFLLNITPFGWALNGAGFGMRKVGGWITSSLLEKTKAFKKSITTFDGAEILDPAKFDVSPFTEVLEKEQTINRILGTRPQIEGLPDDRLLVTKFAEYNMYEDNKTLSEFITRLRDDSVIDAATAERLMHDPNFAQYYEDSIAAQGAALENLYTVIDNNTQVLNTNIKVAMQDQPNKLAQIVAANKAWSEQFSGFTTDNLNLKDCSDFIDRRIASINANLNSLKNMPIKLADSLRTKLNTELYYWNTLRKTFDDMVKELDIDLINLPSIETMRQILSSDKPEQMLDVLIKGNDDILGYEPRLTAARAEYAKEIQDVWRVQELLYNELTDIENAIIKNYQIELKGTLNQKIKHVSRLLRDKNIINASDNLNDLLLDFLDYAKDYRAFEKQLKNLDAEKFASYIDNYMSDITETLLPDLHVIADKVYLLRDLKLDIDTIKAELDKLNQLRNYLTPENLKSLKQKNVTAKNIKKYLDNTKQVDLAKIGTKVKDIAIPAITETSPVYHLVVNQLQALGLFNERIIQQIETALDDTAATMFYIGNARYTREQLQSLKNIVESLDLTKQGNILTIIDELYALDMLDFNTDALRLAHLQKLDPNVTYYTWKQNQAYTLIQLLQAYESNPTFREVLKDLVSDTSTTPIGTLLNAVEQVDTSSLIFNTNIIKSIKNDARAQYNFMNLFNKVMSIRDNELGIKDAFLDYIASNEYKNLETFINEITDANGRVNVDKLTKALNYKVNGLAGSHILKNSNLHDYYGLGKADEILLHNASYDVNITCENFLEQVRRGYTKLEDGEVFTVFDLETTGLDLNQGHQVLQIYGHKYQRLNDTIVDLGEFENVVKLNKNFKEIPKEVRDVIGKDLVTRVNKSRISEETALNEFLDFIGDSTLVGHNSDAFDVPFLEERIGYKLANKKQDTLTIARKVMKMDVKLNDKTVKKLADYLTAYLQQQQRYSQQVIKFIDRNTLNNLYDLARELTASTTGRFLHTQNIIRRMKGNILEDALTQLLGKTTTEKFGNVLSPEIGQELVNTTVDALDVPTGESLLVTIRDILSDIKKINEQGRNYYISSKDIDKAAGFHTNIYAYLNSNLETNGYVSNRFAPKKVYHSNYMRDIEEQYEKLNYNKEQALAFKNIIDENTDPLTKAENSGIIALDGANVDQVARVYYANELVKHGATAETNLNEIGKAAIAYGKDEIGKIAEDIIHYSSVLATTTREQTNPIAEAIAINETRTILEAEPKYLAAFMFDEAPRIRVNNAFNEHYKDLVDNIVNNKELYEEQGIHIYLEDDNLYLDLSGTKLKELSLNSQSIKHNYNFKVHRVQAPEDTTLKTLLDEQDKIFDKANRIRKNPLPFNAQSSVASNMYADNWRALRAKTPNFDDALVDNVDYMRRFFVTRDPKQSYINLGDLNGRKLFNQYQQDPFRAVVTRLEKNIERVDGRNKFIELNFNKDLMLDGPIYRNLSEQDILDIFSSDSKNYTVMVLAQDKNGKAIVKNFRPTTTKDIVKLKELGGVIAPQYYANTVAKTINKLSLDEVFNMPVAGPIAQWYYKYIVSTYKTIYLSTFGMVFRNLNDIVVKNTVGSDLSEVPDTLLQFSKAMQDWIEYDRAFKEIVTYYDDINAQTIAAYFESGHARISRELFDEVHEYATSSISAGMATVQEEMLKHFYISEEASGFEKLFFDNKFRKYTVDQFSNLNTHIEHAGRLSKLRLAKMQGLDALDAYNAVLRTHFDYGVKSKGMLIAELVIPFITFPLYNLQYWIDMAAKSPWIAESLIDATRTSLDVEAQKQFTLDNSNKLQAALLNGNIGIEGTLFKFNPSLFDAINLVTNPVEQLDQRLAAPVKVGVDKLAQSIGQEKIFNKDPDYVSNNVTNLTKLGLGDLEKNANDWGLFPLTRLANNVLKGVALLDDNGDLEKTDHIADALPSMFGEFKQNYGARLNENYRTIKSTINTGSRYTRVKTADGSVVKSTFYPTRYPSYSKGPSPTAGRSYKRIPYTRRYYSPSYNIYNKWKANRINAYTLNAPASPEALQYAFKGLYYKFGVNKNTLKMYNLKQGSVYKVR